MDGRGEAAALGAQTYEVRFVRYIVVVGYRGSKTAKEDMGFAYM